MSAHMINRWTKAYELYIKGDYTAALDLFEVIELSCLDKSSIPKEVTLNKILSIITLKKHDCAIEVGSKLLRSILGPFFLFALGLVQENVDDDESLKYFKKCLLSLREHKELQLTGTSWKLSRFKVYTNLAIMSCKTGNELLAKSYLENAQDAADSDELKRLIHDLKEKGLSRASCIGFPADICIPPPGYNSSKQDDSASEKRKKEETLKSTQSIIVKVNDLSDKGNKRSTNKYYEMLPTPENESESNDHHFEKASVISDSKYEMLPSPPVDDSDHELPAVPVEEESKISKVPKFYTFLSKIEEKVHGGSILIQKKKSQKESSENGNIPLRTSSKLETNNDDVIPELPQESSDTFFPEKASVQIYGLWRTYSVQLDKKMLRLCDEKTKSQVHLEFSLDKFVRIEPALGESYKKLSLFKLIVKNDELIFGLESLQTSLVWISKIMQTALDIPSTQKNVKLLKTGLGREPFKMNYRC